MTRIWRLPRSVPTPFKASQRRCLVLTAVLAVSFTPPGQAYAEGDTTAAAATPTTDVRREVVVALGYGSIVAPRGILVYTAPQTAERAAALDGLSVDVARRVGHLGLGARFWYMGATSDGFGSSAHALTRWTTTSRFYPWTFRTLEPWLGAELGLGLAEDFALWAKTDKEPAHQAASGVRPGLVAGLEAGAQLRVAPPLAFGLRGGLLYMGFDPVKGAVIESPQAAKYLVYPTDYGQRLWLSIALTAELTVPN